MSNLVLAAALELARWHGVDFAAAFLEDQKISSDVIKELLSNELQFDSGSAARQSGLQAHTQ